MCGVYSVCYLVAFFFQTFESSLTLKKMEITFSFLSQIQTFNVEAPCQTVEDLTSGVVMAQVLQKM